MTPTSERVVRQVAILLCAAALIFLITMVWAIVFVPRPATLDQRLNERAKQIHSLKEGLDDIGVRLNTIAGD
jgi:hypothetical protein